MPSDELNYRVKVHGDGGDGFWAEVEELPGCFATGDTMDELWEALAEAIGLYLSTPAAQLTVATVKQVERIDLVEESTVTAHLASC